MALQDHMTPGEPAARAEAGRPPASGDTHRIRRLLMSPLARVLNPLVLGHGGSRRRLKYAVIHHQGRRSGRPFATPTSARPMPDGFVVPMAFGERADWVRNVLAAGGCVLEWEGAQYHLVEPEVGRPTSRSVSLFSIERALLPVFGAKQFVRLRHAPMSSADPT